MAEPLLRLDGLRKRFGALAATDGVSLDVQAGEIHALIGPNGAGKTTLIAQVGGELRPDAGRVLLDGRDVTRWSAPRRAHAGLARCFQVPALVDDFSALENAALAAQARAGSSFRFLRPAAGERALNEDALAALDAVGLGGRAAVPAGWLSHGERRRLELAVALAARPRLLLLDEPLAGAGPDEAAELVALLDRLRARHAVLLVEHDTDAVLRLADRVSVLVGGRVLATGAPAAIRADPRVREAYLGDEEPA